MCGIVGYNGKKKAVPILLDGLSKLEYRGYDSAGIATVDKELEIFKAKGKLDNLRDLIKDKELNGTIGIGHTRWATHGEPSETNAHPHTSNDKNVTLVHNGIIENYKELTEKLKKHNYTLYSETDTEVLANIIDYYYKKYKMGPMDALNRTMLRVKGSYAIAVIFKEYPEDIWVARKDSPLIIGENEDGKYLASDVPAILKYTNKIYYLDNLEVAELKKDKIIFYDLNGDEIKKESKTINWDIEKAEKNGYEHFMIKEIHEQSEVVEKTINSLISDDINTENIGLTPDYIKSIEEIYIVACGSAYHVGYCGEYIFEDLSKIKTRTMLASEFRYRNPIINEKTLVIIISQSGETADSLAALREAKSKGAKTLAIVNVNSSSIAREADNVIYTLAGPEISVATTKAFSCQLIVIYTLAIYFAKINNKIDNIKYNDLINELKKIPEKIDETLKNLVKHIQKISSKFSSIHDAFYLGRGLDYAISLEGSLKLKEVSYIHSEAYASGELKHGTISLIEDNTLVIGIITQDEIFEKTLSNLVEVKSRGAYIIAIVPNDKDIKNIANDIIYIPKTNKYFYPSLSVIPLQLIAYYITVAKGLDVDKPRNLAKSVTVE